jgi:hypothetical protein
MAIAVAGRFWIDFLKLTGDSYGHVLVSGNWPVTAMAMDRCLENGQ